MNKGPGRLITLKSPGSALLTQNPQSWSHRGRTLILAMAGDLNYKPEVRAQGSPGPKTADNASWPARAELGDCHLHTSSQPPF